MSHPIYAYIENRGGYKQVDGRLVKDDSIVVRYLKTFSDKDVFDLWGRHTCGPGKYITVIKWWRDRPPCDELAAIKKEFPENLTKET